MSFLISFFKNLFSKGESFIPTPTQSIPGLEPIVVQAIENLYPDIEDQKQAFKYSLEYKEKLKREDTLGLLAMLAYSKGKMEQLPNPKLWLDGHFRVEEISPIFSKMKDAEEWVKSITKTQV
jgi:hypothetical protein